MFSWPEFVHQLKVNFGPLDPVGDAEDDLEHQKMKDNQRFTKYNIEFNHLAAQCKWEGAPLHWAYYKGLPAQIKDNLMCMGKGKDLKELQEFVLTINACYWKWHSELTHKQPQLKSNKPVDLDKPSHGKSDKKPTSSNPSTSAMKSHGNTPSSSMQKKSPLADKLEKDGKLMPEECQHCLDNNLCLFCSKSGHIAKECPKSSSTISKAKAQAAKASEEPKK